MPVEKQIKYEKERQNNVKVDTIIRKTLSFIENDIRFVFLQAISCYVDMIRVTLGKRANPERDIPDVVTWLELGISNDTELSFLKMGLNRYSAIALSSVSTWFIITRGRPSSSCLSIVTLTSRGCPDLMTSS